MTNRQTRVLLQLAVAAAWSSRLCVARPPSKREAPLRIQVGHFCFWAGRACLRAQQVDLLLAGPSSLFEAACLTIHGLICWPECPVCCASSLLCDLPETTHQPSAFCSQAAACLLVPDSRDQVAPPCACRAPRLPLCRAACAAALSKSCRVAGCPQQGWQCDVAGCQRILWQPGLP